MLRKLLCAEGKQGFMFCQDFTLARKVQNSDSSSPSPTALLRTSFVPLVVALFLH